MIHNGVGRKFRFYRGSVDRGMHVLASRSGRSETPLMLQCLWSALDRWRGGQEADESFSGTHCMGPGPPTWPM